MVHKGRIIISQEVLLEWLTFKGGKITDLAFADSGQSVSFSVEHPDMPLVREGGVVPIVMPTPRIPYTRTQ